MYIHDKIGFEMAQAAEQEKQKLTLQRKAEILTLATKREGGLKIKVGKIGPVSLMVPQMLTFTNETVGVKKDDGIIIIQIYNEERDSYLKLTPGNKQLNQKLLEWLEIADENIRNGVNYGHPTQVCFNQI